MQRLVAVAVCAVALLSAAAVRGAESEAEADAAAEARVAHILATSRVPHHVSDELMYTVLYDADAREGAAHTFGPAEVVSRFMELQLHRCRADPNHWFALSTQHEGEKRGRDGCGECAIMVAHAHTQPAALSFLETTAAGGAESEADAAHGLVSAVQRGCRQLLAAPCCANAPAAQGGDLLLEAQAHLERVLPEQLEGASLLEATSEYWTHRRAKALPKNLRFGVAAEDDSEDDAAADDEEESDAEEDAEDAEDVDTVLLAVSERVDVTSRAALRASMRQQRAALLNGVSARSPLHELDFVDRIVRALDEQMSRPDSSFDTTLIGRLLNSASGANRIRVPTPADNIPAPKRFDLIAASTDVRDKEAALNAADEAGDIAAEEANPWQPKRKPSRAVRNVRKEHQRKAKLLRRLVHKRDGPVPTPNRAGTVKAAADYDQNEVSRLVVKPKPKPQPKAASDADADADADAEGDTDAPAGFAAPKPAVSGSAKVQAAHAAVSASKAATASEETQGAAAGAAAAVKTNVALKLIKKVKSADASAKAKAKAKAAKKKKFKAKKAKGKGKKKQAKGKGKGKKKAAPKEDDSVWEKIENGVENAAKAVKGAAEKAVKAVKKAFADVANSDVVKSLKILFGGSAVPDLNTKEMAAWKARHLKRLDNRMKAPVGDTFAPNANRPFHGHAKCDPVSGTGAAQRIVGVAESHGHMFSALSFGGDYIHGGFNGTTAEALKPCNGQFTQHGAGLGSEAFHQYRTKYNGGWPRWDSTSHQQMHVSWLKAAAQRKDQYALKTIFLTAVHNDLICLLYKLLGRIPKQFLTEWERAGYKADDVCDDVPNYERQMRAAHELAAAESSWMGLAKTPAECRDLIAAGKLCAIQAGGEVGDMCKRNETPEECVDRIHSKGARVLQLCHLRNNRYSGIGMHTEYINTAGTILEILRDYKASGHNPSAEVKSKTGLLKVLAVVKDAWNRLSNTVKAIGKELSTYPWRHEKHNLVGAPNTVIKYNPKGLSPLGVRLVERAIALRMPIDVSHASRETVRAVYGLAKKHSFFPFFSSHANIMETEDAEHATEYNIEFEEMQRVLEVGGFVGMRPNPNTYPMYTKAKHRTTCQGSTSAFAQNTEFLARELALPITFATDFNGAASNLHPRFYNKKADTHKIWTFESCRGERSCMSNAVSPLDWFMDASTGDAITNTIGNLKAVFSKTARDEQLDKSGKCAKELTEILAEQHFQTTNAIAKARTDPTAVFDTTGLGRIDGVSHAAKDMAHLGASMNCPVCMLSGAENAIRTWERAFLPGTKRKAMPVKSFLMAEPGNPHGPKALLETLSYTFDGPFKGPYTTDEQYVAGAPDNCLPQIAHDA